VFKRTILDLLQQDVVATTNDFIDGNKDAVWNPEVSVDHIKPVEVEGRIYFEMVVNDDGQAETLFVPTRIDLPLFLAESTPLLAEQLPTVFSKPVVII